MRFAVIGPGRAGRSFADALSQHDARLASMLGRGDDPSQLDPDLDLVVIAVPDREIRSVASRVPVGPLVVHVSGASTLAPLRDRHERCGSLHPLVSLPDPERGAAALRSHPHMAIAGSTPAALAEVRAVADRLGARSFEVSDDDRAAYHAAAAIAANHLVALVGQVGRITNRHGIPLHPFADMMRAVLDNVEASDPASALTGPVARGDWDTVRSHLAAIDPAEHHVYLALAGACAALAGRSMPADLVRSTDTPIDRTEETA